MKFLLTFLFINSCFAQSVLILSCPSYRAGTNLICTINKTGDAPAGLQFTFNADGRTSPYIASVSGTAIVAGKDIQCGPAACIISGINAQTISDGQVAQFSVPIPANVTGNLIFSLTSPVG